MSLLGIQVSARGCRAVAVTPSGQVVAQGGRPLRPAPKAGAGEWDSSAVWAAVRDLLAELAAATRGDPVTAMSVAALGEALVPLTPEGQMLDRCLLGNDDRGAHYVDRVAERLGRERLFALTGGVPGPHYALQELCWLRDEEPEVFRRAGRFVPWSTLITYLLGGALKCDFTLASRTLLLDLDAGAWSREVLAAAALPMHKLPELAPAGQAAGTMDPAVARELGYPPGVRLLVGGHELCCNALGAGVVAPQAAALSLASSLHLMPTFQAVPLVEMMRHERLSIAPHLVPGLFVTLLYHRSGGRLLRWFRDTLAPMEAREAQRHGAQIYPQLLAEMPAGPSPLLALPYFDAAGPPTFEPGRAGAILGLGLDSTRGEILKALLEAAAFPLAEGLEALNRVGISLAGLRAAGEGVRADAWLQLLADVLGLPIERTALAEPAPLGAALVAGVGTGVYDDYEQAVAATVRVTQRFEPDPRRHSQYRAKLTRYQALRARLAAGAPAPATD